MKTNLQMQIEERIVYRLEGPARVSGFREMVFQILG